MSFLKGKYPYSENLHEYEANLIPNPTTMRIRPYTKKPQWGVRPVTTNTPVQHVGAEDERGVVLPVEMYVNGMLVTHVLFVKCTDVSQCLLRLVISNDF